MEGHQTGCELSPLFAVFPSVFIQDVIQLSYDAFQGQVCDNFCYSVCYCLSKTGFKAMWGPQIIIPQAPFWKVSKIL